ncbi:GRIM-19 protein [Ditylenchus destructor]|nr:GRIM-19 protein [Ditylenchus destructor]
MPVRQDMPPPGGYDDFNFHRTFAKASWWWRPKIAVPAIVGIYVYGYYAYRAWNKHMINEKFEDTDIFNAMDPFLSAERDRYWLKLLKKNLELENEVMKDVPGWKAGTWYGEPVFFTLGDKWWDPHYFEVYTHSRNIDRKEEFTWRNADQYRLPRWYDQYLPEKIVEMIR